VCHLDPRTLKVHFWTTKVVLWCTVGPFDPYQHMLSMWHDQHGHKIVDTHIIGMYPSSSLAHSSRRRAITATVPALFVASTPMSGLMLTGLHLNGEEGKQYVPLTCGPTFHCLRRHAIYPTCADIDQMDPRCSTKQP
jgi:hypothetical protein